MSLKRPSSGHRLWPELASCSPSPVLLKGVPAWVGARRGLSPERTGYDRPWGEASELSSCLPHVHYPPPPARLTNACVTYFQKPNLR